VAQTVLGAAEEIPCVAKSIPQPGRLRARVAGLTETCLVGSVGGFFSLVVLLLYMADGNRSWHQSPTVFFCRRFGIGLAA
jgi:hypothetical protein